MKGKFSEGNGSTTQQTAAVDTMRGVPDKLLRDTIAAVIGSGAAVMFASTRNGDAIMVQLMHGQERAKAYASNVQELREILSDAAASVAG